MVMVFAFPHTLLRRPLLALRPHRGPCPRLLATQSQKRGAKAARAPPAPRGDGRRKRGLPVAPPPRTIPDLPKAAHMRPGAGPQKDGWGEWLAKNPIVFAVFVFPTITMGILILAKPNLRAQLSGDGDRDKDGGRAGVFVNSAPPAPAYGASELAAGAEGAAGTREEEGGEAAVARASASERGADEDATAVVQRAVSSVAQASGGAEGASAPGEEPGGKAGAPVVVDRIRALGLRPHPSS